MRARIALAIMALVSGCDEAVGGADDEMVIATSTGEIDPRFDAPAPRTCVNKNAPANGPMTAEIAMQYVICDSEYITGTTLYLVEDVSVQVGGGVPYVPNLGAFREIDVETPLYPIRGSLLRYQCSDVQREYIGPAGTNCGVYDNPNATGYCYKTTFKDWRCFMSDRNVVDAKWGVAAPRREGQAS